MAITEKIELKVKFKYPHLFRDDLLKIEKIVADQLKPGYVSFDFGTFKVDSISDLPLKGSTKDFSLYTSRPSLQLYLSKGLA